MTTISLYLHPLDVLLFRDGRPFSPGDTARTQLPLPQTFAGAIKTHITHVMDWTSRHWHGQHDLPPEERPWHARLKFRGPWLFVHDPTALGMKDQAPFPLLPTPADIVRLGKGKSAPLARLRPLNVDETPLPGWTPIEENLLPLWSTQQEKTQPPPEFIDVMGLRQYLAGDCPDHEHLWCRDTLVLPEHRTGIGIDPDRLTADQERGLIYSATFLRLKQGVCFYGEVDLPDDGPDKPSADQLFPPGTCVPWGGEGKRVILQKVERFNWTSLQPSSVDDRLLSLLVTPGIFWNAGHPWKPIEKGALRAAAVPRPLPVSGWDLAGVREQGQLPRPRPTRFAVPAGAVYFWQRSAKRLDDAVTPPPLESLCNKPMDQDNGWGLSLSGTWKYCQL